MIIFVVGVYLLLVILIGILGHRFFRGTGEDYFVASRSIGPFVLLMTLLGTNLTAFTMLGASGEAYRRGIVVFGLMGSSSSILIPFLFYYLGTRCWWLGKKFGYVTQIQLIRDRYGSGGMRSTSWANTFQTTVFIVVGAVAYFVIMDHYGGVGQAMERLRQTNRELVVFGNDRFTTLQMFSYLLLPICAAAFPHIYSHWLSAKTARSFKIPIVFYPLCIAAVWVPSVTLGVIGRIDFATPLNGPILVELILANTDGVLAGCLAAGVFAAIMSSLDSQILSLGAMFTEDIVRFYGFDNQLSERQQILFGRIFVMAFLIIAFVASLFTSRSIFELGIWSLTGFSGLLPVFIGALYWRRSTKQGATAAIVTVVVLWIFFYIHSLASHGHYTLGATGLMPVAVIVPASTLMLVLVSLTTSPPGDTDRFFPAK